MGSRELGAGVWANSRLGVPRGAGGPAPEGLSGRAAPSQGLGWGQGGRPGQLSGLWLQRSTVSADLPVPGGSCCRERTQHPPSTQHPVPSQPQHPPSTHPGCPVAAPWPSPRGPAEFRRRWQGTVTPVTRTRGAPVPAESPPPGPSRRNTAAGSGEERSGAGRDGTGLPPLHPLLPGAGRTHRRGRRAVQERERRRRGGAKRQRAAAPAAAPCGRPRAGEHRRSGPRRGRCPRL